MSSGNQKASSMLSTKESRQRWFLIMDRKRTGRVDKSDLLNFAPKFDLDLEKASELFDRLDSDNDGFMTETDWDRVTALLAYDGLVRAEVHPMYMAYFLQKELGALPLERLKQIATSNGLNGDMLDRPDEMLPLNPTDVSDKPAPPSTMPARMKGSSHLVPRGPTFRSGKHPVDLPTQPFCPAHLRPRARASPKEAPAGPMQPMKWASLAVAAIDGDRAGTLRHALASPVFDINARVKGGKYGTPFALGPVYSFFVETHFRREKEATKRRMDQVIAQEGRCRLPDEVEAIQQQAVRHIRYGGGADDESQCLFETVELGDTLLHLAARAFSPEVGYLLLRSGSDIELRNDRGDSALDLWEDSLYTFTTVPVPSNNESRASSQANSARKSGRGGFLPPVPGATAAAAAAAASGGAEEERSWEGNGCVAKRWRARKRDGKWKLGWLEKYLEEVMRRLTEQLEAVAEIRDTRVAYLETVGGSLTEWEADRLGKRDHLAHLAEQAGFLLAKVRDTDPASHAAAGPTGRPGQLGGGSSSSRGAVGSRGGTSGSGGGHGVLGLSGVAEAAGLSRQTSKHSSRRSSATPSSLVEGAFFPPQASATHQDVGPLLNWG